MTAEIICVGTEILLGNIVNTNAAYLSERLASLGISVFFETTVGDNPERLENVIRQGLERSDILILSGGLGPTKDDLTKEIATKACGQGLVEDEEALRRLKEYFARSHRNMTENNLKQALVPEDCTVLYNENGTAPGMVIHAKEGKKVVLLPGPPNELLPMFHDQVEPIIKELSSEVLYSDVVKIDCMGESRVAAEIEDLIEKQTNPTVAPYAKLGEVHLRVTAKAVSEDEAKKLVTPITEELYRRFGHKIFTTKEDETLEDVVVDMLSKHHYTIAAAESCTAGMFTARLVNVAGASDVLNESFITYANEAKMKYLGVKEETQAVIEVLLLKQIEDNVWECLTKPARRIKEGTIVTFGEGKLKMECVKVLDEGLRHFKMLYEGIFYEILDELGTMPLPPYIHESLKDNDRYQTVYAKYEGSAAAPTAGLHFTPELFEKIKAKGIDVANVTLHVGIGTFRPVKVENVEEHHMHSEHFYIKQEDADKINNAKKNGKRVIAVGTTSCRVLETIADENGMVKPTEGDTQIFIYPGYKYKCLDGLVTNFHLPESTLIMLVSALAGRDYIMKAYNEAVKERYRFFSFGDAMLIL